MVSVMMEQSRRQEYLEAMGIEQWVSRDRAFVTAALPEAGSEVAVEDGTDVYIEFPF
jgi:hypothetical protein